MRALLVLVAGLAAAAPAAAEPLLLTILPAGQSGFIPVAGPPSPHLRDQLALYAGLPVAGRLRRESDVLRFYKDARVAPPASPESVETPRPGCTIARDAFGLPHVTGTTRDDVFFGAGWVLASDRLFLADALRHIGRGRLSEFLGPDLGLDFDRTYYRVAGHSRDELRAIADGLAARLGPFGAQLRADAEAFIAGINAYIALARIDPARKPLEYDALGAPFEDWELSDVVAATITFTTVIGFGNGGGGEHENVILKQALAARYPAETAAALFDDLRSREDPEAPVTTEREFPYMAPAPSDPAAVAIIDPGSFQPKSPLEVAAAPSPRALPVPRGMSNWLVVAAKRATGRHPILVGGPQTGYFAPQALVEVALEGGGISVQGATVPGVPYVVLGHTERYAWTATAGGSDLTDVRVERPCTPAGGDVDAGTMWKGACVPMYRRTDTWVAGGRTVTAVVERSVHGDVMLPVVGRATVNGQPVILTRERTSWGREAESAPAFMQLNAGQATTPEAFRAAMASNNSTLNWVWADGRDVAYFHSGAFPRRAPGVDPELPSWGTGEWDWQGFLGADEQPFDVNPRRGFMTSWNNKPARGWRAADRTFSYGPLYRSLMLDVRLRAALRGGRVSVPEAVTAMADAATVDFRGETVAAEALRLAKGDRALRGPARLLARWVRHGSHRRDVDLDGEYDDTAAVALMDEWYPRLVHAAFDAQLDGLYGRIPMGFDNAPSDGNLGSAYQDGYYGYLRKVLRQARGARVRGAYRVLRCADGTRSGCGAAVTASLADAVAALTQRFGSSDPAAWRADPTRDEIRFSLGGLASAGPIPWQNRPTWQQVVQYR